MKYELLYIEPINESDHSRYTHYSVLLQETNNKVLTHKGARRLGESSWLIPDTELLPIVTSLAAGIKNLGLKVEVACLDEVVWKPV